MRELRLELQGKKLSFPDGKAVCLACGAEPAGVRRVWFEELQHHAGFSKSAALETGVQAIRERIAFDAPLCRAHRVKARWLGVGAALCMLAAVGMIALGAMLFGASPGRKPKSFFAEWGPILLGFIPGIPGYLLWRMKDRGGLRCDVRREAATGLILSFPDDAR